MKVLVTGASGFIGRALVTALATSKHDVRAAVRHPNEFDFPKSVEVMSHGDLGSPIDWAPLLAGIDAVVHLAGIAHVGLDVGETLYERVNHLATAELAAAAKRAGINRLVFISSVRAQSGPTACHVLTETKEPRPTDAYGRSKLAAENALLASGLPVAILRPALVYGPGVKGNFAALMRLASLPLPLPFGSFRNRRSLLSRDSLIEAIQFVLGDPNSSGQIYLVADTEALSLAAIIAALRYGLGQSPRLFHVPPALIGLVLRSTGRKALWSRLGGDLVVDSTKLVCAGWRPVSDAQTALANAARTSRAVPPSR